MQETVRSGWSTRQLERQINTYGHEKSPQAAKPLVDVDFWRRVWDSNPRAL